MNRNQMIGMAIGKFIGRGIQIIFIYQTANVVGPVGAIAIRTGTTCTVKLVRYTAKNYVRTNFASEQIFSDSIDAIMEAY